MLFFLLMHVMASPRLSNLASNSEKKEMMVRLLGFRIFKNNPR